MLEFNELIKSLKVVSVPIMGCKFNWFKLDGNAMIRLDRFLLMDGLLNLWNIEGQRVGSWDIFDYCPIWIRGKEKN